MTTTAAAEAAAKNAAFRNEKNDAAAFHSVAAMREAAPMTREAAPMVREVAPPMRAESPMIRDAAPEATRDLKQGLGRIECPEDGPEKEMFSEEFGFEDELVDPI